MPGFNRDTTGATDQNIVYADNYDFSGSAAPTRSVISGGQLPIGTGGVPAIKVGVLTSPDGSVTIGYSNPNITLSAGGPIPLTNYTNVNHALSPYTVLSADYYISVDTSGGTVILNFPNAPAFKRTWIVKDRTGNASVNNITLTTPGGIDTFDGLTSYLIKGNCGAVNILANSSPNYEIY